MAYMLSSWLKIYVFVTKATINYCPRKLPGACHGDDFGLVEKWKSLFWAVQTVIVSSAESQQRPACVNKTLN